MGHLGSKFLAHLFLLTQHEFLIYWGKIGLKRIETNKRGSMGEERLSNLTTIHLNRPIMTNSKPFYMSIEKFSTIWCISINKFHFV